MTFIYRKRLSVILLSLYVDDGLCATNDEKMYKNFLKQLSNDFELSDQGRFQWYLGVHIKQDLQNKKTKISQTQYIKDILERFGMTGATPVTTPMEPNTHLTRADCPSDDKVDKLFKREYQRNIGALMYLSFTRPDLAHSVNQCSRFMSNPGPSHMVAARRILRYLAGTMEMGITYVAQPKSRENVLWGFADADHAGDPDTRRSVTGYVLMMCGGAVAWSSTRQAVTALSSSEAEFYAASGAGCDVKYLRGLLDEFGIKPTQPTIVYEDNWVCIHLLRNAILHNKSKHIDVRVYHLRDLCKAGVMTLMKISTHHQVADALTKALPRPAFQSHRKVMLNLG